MKYLILLLAAASLTGCNGCGGGNGPWEPVTKRPPDHCEGCPEIDLGEVGGHGAEVILLQDPTVDDELVQWATCLTGFMTCIDDGGAEDTCMRDAPCPKACADAYFEAVGGAPDDDYPSRADAVEAVFMNEGGLCVLDAVLLARGVGVTP